MTEDSMDGTIESTGGQTVTAPDSNPTATAADGRTDNAGKDPDEKTVRAIERKCGLRPGQGLHTFFITVNNPTDHFEDCRNMTPEEIVDWALARCLRNRKGELRKSRGATVCFERGEKEHTDHLHIALSFTGRNGGKVATVVNLWPTADIERANGTVEEIEDYLSKTGRHADKKDTTVVPPKHDGEPLMPNPRAKRNKGKDDPPDPGILSKRDLRWRILRQAVLDGMSEGEIWADEVLGIYAAELNYPLQKIIELRRAAVEIQRPKQRAVRTLWVQLEPGTSASITEISIRHCLELHREGYGRWGQWRLGAVFQPGVSIATNTLYVDARERSMSSDEELERLVTGVPLQVTTRSDRSFWAAWTNAVVLALDPPSPVMSSLGQLHSISIPPGKSLKETNGLMHAALNGTKGVDLLTGKVIDSQTGNVPALPASGATVDGEAGEARD